jgi:hypothetical protein
LAKKPSRKKTKNWFKKIKTTPKKTGWVKAKQASSKANE